MPADIQCSNLEGGIALEKLASNEGKVSQQKKNVGWLPIVVTLAAACALLGFLDHKLDLVQELASMSGLKSRRLLHSTVAAPIHKPPAQAVSLPKQSRPPINSALPENRNDETKLPLWGNGGIKLGWASLAFALLARVFFAFAKEKPSGARDAVLELSENHQVSAKAEPIHHVQPIISQRHSALQMMARSIDDVGESRTSKVEMMAASEAPPLTPVKVVPALISIALGLVIRFVVPIPASLSAQAWSMLAIFVSTIAGVVLGPLPVGAWSLCGLTAALATKTMTFPQAFSAFTSDVTWLMTSVFFIARAFVKSGLGDRMGFMFARKFGKTTLGLGYALTTAEALVAPGLPSIAARHGGIMLPVIRSLAKACGSDPEKGTQKKMGAYLVQNAMQSGNLTSAIFLTGAAQNLLCASLSEAQGSAAITFATWLKASCVPGFITLALTPLLLFKVFPPETKETPDAPAMAADKLAEMGPPKLPEKITLATVITLLGLWVFGPSLLGVSSATTALLGVSSLLCLGVVSWQDVLQEKGAWDTLLWFTVLVGMSSQVQNLGVVTWFAAKVSGLLTAAAVSWPLAFFLLHSAYFGLHYIFASQTAQVGALFAAFLAMMIGSGVPTLLAGLTLAFSSNLFAGITHYASAQGALYYGAGYVDLKSWWRIGLMVAIFQYGLFFGIGAVWWKFIGLF